MKIRTRPKVIAAGLLIFAITAIVGVKLSARSSPASKTAQKVVPGDNRLVVHEWGTFTSIAGKDGVALEWRPLNGSTDLPKFVYTIQEANKGLRHTSIKDDLIDRKSTRLNSSHGYISYAVFCLKKKKKK